MFLLYWKEGDRNGGGFCDYVKSPILKDTSLFGNKEGTSFSLVKYVC